MLNLLGDPVLLLSQIAALIAAITVHEFAHALVAVRLGDPTPKLQKRLTLNPIAHLDPFGTLLPVILLLTGSSFIFGWGKPVIFDSFNLEKPRRDSALISLAGPVSNLIFASILSIILRIAILPFSYLSFLVPYIPVFIVLNVILAIFNLVPIHPLDGGKILVGLLPAAEAARADTFMKRYGIFILILLIFPVLGGSILGPIIYPIMRFLLGIYIPGASTI